MSEEELARRVEELERRVEALEGAPRPPAATGAKKQSLREFLKSKDPKNSVDASLFIAYYMEKDGSLTPFTVEDLGAGFDDAREPRPGNMSDMVYKLARRGLVAEAPEKKGGSKAYVVTNSGERFVENGLKPV